MREHSAAFKPVSKDGSNDWKVEMSRWDSEHEVRELWSSTSMPISIKSSVWMALDTYRCCNAHVGSGSLLLSIYKAESLASAIARAFEREADGAPNDQSRPTPGSEAVKGVLRAIEDQTSSFDWRNFLLAVAKKLDFPDEKMLVRDYKQRLLPTMKINLL